MDAEAAPDYFLVNCAHPSHVAPALDAEANGWTSRIEGIRPNASRMSHAELDEAPELDEGDPADLAAGIDALRANCRTCASSAAAAAPTAATSPPSGCGRLS